MGRYRTTNADKVIEHYKWNNWQYTKADKIRYDADTSTVIDNGVIIGKFITGYNNYTDMFFDMLVLTMQNYKSRPSWRTHKKQLAASANREGIYVVFVEELDIGFGLGGNATCSSNIIRAVDCYPALIEIAKYSQDTDVKTAACFISRTGAVDDRPFVYSYNQSIDTCMIHAEEVCLMYYDTYRENEGSLDLDAVSLLEPCVKCLTNMIDAGIKRITFGYAHKDKWNTDEYWQVVDDIHARIHNTVYERIKDKNVDKFYERSKNVNNV